MAQSLPLPFPDREAAGAALAEAIRDAGVELDLVLSLPRGGVATGAAIASALNLTLDVFLVRKVGAPDQPELALGALAETGHLELNHSVLASVHVAEGELTAIIAAERQEIERRLKSYRSGRPPPSVEGRRVVIVDDGVATGATMLVALRALRAHRPARLVAATPLCPPSVVRRLQAEFDEVFVVATPKPFAAVGSWYKDFHQMSDDEVMELLQRGRSSGART